MDDDDVSQSPGMYRDTVIDFRKNSSIGSSPKRMSLLAENDHVLSEWNR
eukprot:UN06109